MQLTTTSNEQARTDHLELLDRYWRAANYLSVGQIYLLANPLLREPLKPEHINLGCLGIGAPRRASTSSMRTSIV